MADGLSLVQSFRLLNETVSEPIIEELKAGHVAYFARKNPLSDKPFCGDSLLIMELDNGETILTLADGAGGTPDGDRASATVLKKVQSLITQSKSQEPRVRALDGFEKANDALLSEGKGSATTLNWVTIVGKKYRSHHVGDSVTLVCGQRGKLKFQSLPHSPAGYALESGIVEESEISEEDHKVYVINLVGTREMRIDVSRLKEIKPSDRLLICSDGITDNLSTDSIVEIVRKGPLDKAAHRLAEETLETMTKESDSSKPDDHSFVLFQRK